MGKRPSASNKAPGGRAASVRRPLATPSPLRSSGTSRSAAPLTAAALRKRPAALAAPRGSHAAAAARTSLQWRPAAAATPPCGRKAKKATGRAARATGAGRSIQKNAAVGLVRRSVHDPLFWGLVLSEPKIKAFLCRSLSAKVAEDPRVAGLVVRAAAALKERVIWPEGCRHRDESAPVLADSSEGGGHGTAPAAAVPVAKEVLSKRRRRICRSQGSVGPTSAHAVVGQAKCALGDFTIDLLTQVLVGVDFKTKLWGLLPSSKHMRQVMQCRAAWDPLHLDQVTGRGFLRMLKQRDPLGCFEGDVSRTKRLFPVGLFEVCCLEAVLMDPERVTHEQSDTEEDAPKPRQLVVADPLDEICKRLRYYFSSVNQLLVSNIEDYRMDYRFLGLRSGNLSNFGFVELVHCNTRPTTYSLVALRNAPPRPVDACSALIENRSRVPPDVRVDASTMLSEREALYLMEHRNAFKNGDNFHFKHAVFRTVRSHAVRKNYKAVVASLRERFPEQFREIVDPCSPEPPLVNARAP